MRTPVSVAPTIIDFVTDKQLLGLTISPAQRALLKSIYGLSLDAEERALFHLCTGRSLYPAHAFSEVAVVAGARSGKDSRIAAPVALFEAIFGHHERSVARGERPVIPLVAQDARGAKIAFGYIREYLTGSPLLRTMLDSEPLAQEITLSNGISVQCFPCTLRSLRGYSIPCGVMDELAFYRLEGQADSDAEIQTSIRRGMLGFPRTKLVKISTPYMKSGVLFDDFRRAFGQDDPDLLVWRASTAQMNPTITTDRLAREQRLDPLRFAREYLGEFAEDMEAFLPGAWVDQAVQAGRHELPPQPSAFRYTAACDPSGGGADAFTLAVCHLEGSGNARRVVQDVMRGWTKPRTATADLSGVVNEIAALVKSYGCHVVYGDRYAAGWVVGAFREAGLRYETPTHRVPGKDDPEYMDRSAAYLECSPLFAQGAVLLLDHPPLVRELKLLERRPQAGGRTRVDHPSGSHDDLSNACCLAVAMAARSSPKPWAGAVLPAGLTVLGSPSGQVGQPVGGGQLGALQRGTVGGQAEHLARPYGRWG